MTTTTLAKAPSQADIRVARQLLGLFQWLGPLWSTAIRDAGGGSVGRFKTLSNLHGRGAIRAGELSTLCGTTPSATTEVIESLVSEGLVQRVDDPSDRRAVKVSLTAAGQGEIERVAELMTKAVVKTLDGLSAEQKTRLRAAVADLSEILVAPATHSVPSAQKETRNVR